MSVKSSNFTFVFLNVACQANPGAERNFAEAVLYILRHIFRKFSDTSTNNNVSL